MSKIIKIDLLTMSEALMCGDFVENPDELHKCATETARNIGDAIEGLSGLIDCIQPNSGMEGILMPKLASNLRVLGSVLNLCSRSAEVAYITLKFED